MNEDVESLIAEHFQRRYGSQLESVIRGTRGLVVVLRNPPGTVPERFAVKTLNPEGLRRAPTADAVRRFKRELEQWYKYGDHRLILRPLYVEILKDWPLVAMPFCDRNLRCYLDLNRPQRERLVIAVQICHGLAYAVSRGLVAHQDLKPENVLLEDCRKTFELPDWYPIEWLARVADFGLSNAFVELGEPHGSRPYMAPEQYSGSADLMRADIFALGVIFTELFSGLHPIGRRTIEVWPCARNEADKKWRHERPWKRWALSDGKFHTSIRIEPATLMTLIQEMTSTDVGVRPDITTVEARLMEVLRAEDADGLTVEHLECVLKHFDTEARLPDGLKQAQEQYSERQLKKIEPPQDLTDLST